MTHLNWSRADARKDVLFLFKSQEKIEYYQEIKTISSITILVDSTNKEKSPNDLQLVTFIVRKLNSFYDEYKQFKSRAMDDQSGDPEQPLKLSVFDIAKLASQPSEASQVSV